MAKLPKSIIKKYGISKKAWQVFRGQKPGKRSNKMAKRRNTKKKFSKKSTFLNSAFKILVGVAGAVAYEVFLSPMIPLDSMIKNIVELALGLVLMFVPGMPMAIKATGAALATVNAYTLIYPLFSGATNSAAAPQADNWSSY